MNVGTKVDLNKLRAIVNGKSYRVKSFTLNLALNTPAACSVVLAQGMNRRRTYEFNSPDEFEQPFTTITVELTMQNQEQPIVLFRGFVANIAKQASRNAKGSFAGTVLACVAAPSALQAARIQGYRFWATETDGQGPSPAPELFLDDSETLGNLSKEAYTYGGVGAPTYNGTIFKTNVGDYITEILGHFSKIVSRGFYTEEIAIVHKMSRGIDVKPAPEIADGPINGLTPEFYLVMQLKNLLKRTDALSAWRALVSGPLYMTLVPTTAGAFDIIPEFPWDANPLTTLNRGDYLALNSLNNYMGDVAFVDAVYVPVGFSSGIAGGFEIYPEDVIKGGLSGVSRVVDMPPWMSPYAGISSPEGGDEQETDDDDFTGTNRSGVKKTKSDIDETNKTATTLAQKLAKMGFNRVQSSGSGLQVEVPWYRLEFLEALGYVIKIERPSENATEEKDLYGYLNSAALTISSTTGGSSAKLKLGFSHVRSEEANENAFDGHPFWEVTDTFRDNFAAVEGSVNFYNRADQISLQGDTYDGYLDEVKELMSGRQE